MFLLIGDAGDACCAGVERVLRRRGYEVLRTGSPLAAPFALSWRIDNSAATRMEWAAACGTPRQISGVLLRPSARLVDPEGWNAKDLAYMQHETQAALVAWLWALDCPVINRPSADLFFRPYRSYPEWHHLFAACRLPAAPICITNDLDTARAFGARWASRATYAPLSAPTRYPLVEPGHWDELAKLLAHVPVCLMPPSIAPGRYATVVGESVVWDEGTPRDLRRLDCGLVRLARHLRLDSVQVEITSDGDACHCVTVNPFPVLERHDRAAQAAVVEALVERLGAPPRSAIGPRAPIHDGAENHGVGAR